MASDGETSCANDPNFAAIYSFLKVFGNLHGLELPTIDKLQEFIENTEEVSDALKEVHLKLLRRALKSAHSDRWEKCLIKFCHQQGHHQEAWEIERFSYKKASTQVKLKVLKFLLEFQFTCHPKFKSAVNAIPSKELRMDPIGRDKNGCVYWLHIDNDANMRLYKEDRDEETWQLIARNREELAKVITKLKSGQEITAASIFTENEASSEPEYSPERPSNPEIDEDNEEEFLSPESESEHEEDPGTDQNASKENQQDSESTPKEPCKVEHEDTGTDPNASKEDPQALESTPKEPCIVEDEDQGTHPNASKENQQASESTPKEPCKVNPVDNIQKITEEIPKEAIKESVPEIIEKSTASSAEVEPIVNEYTKDSESCTENSPVVNKISNDKYLENVDKEDTKNENIESKNVSIEDIKNINKDGKLAEKTSDARSESIQTNDEDNKEESTEIESKIEVHKTENEQDLKAVDIEHKSNDLENNFEVSEEVEDPLMIVTGEGNGVDCDSYFLGEEISEAVLYFYGEGCGYDNDTGNPEAITETNEAKSEDENESRKELVNDCKDLLNGEHDTNTTTKISNVKVKSVAKRSLKKQPSDSNDTNIDTKKPCMREDKSNSSKAATDLKTETSVNDKSTTDSESPKKNKEAQDSKSPKKNNVKKQRSKMKKKVVVRKIKTNDAEKPINTALEIDNGQDKTSIIEKRKSSVSSLDENLADVSKENSDKEDPLAMEEPLPPKKLRLETTPESDVNATHSKDVSDAKDVLSDGKEAVSDGAIDMNVSLNDSISKRKKIKAHKGKFKRQRNQGENKNDKVIDRSKKGNKSLKRSLVEATMSDKNKSESQSESEDDEPITSGKRLKIKPKKIITSSRKKIEAKLQEEHSSDESEEETLYSLAGKKFANKKLIKKKKSKDSKDKKSKTQSDDSDTPVRQSRRIAQQKIKEEAERRHQEEIALRELKMIHKKKGKDDDDEEEWRASGRGSSSEEENKRRHKKTWRASDSTGPEPDSDSDSPLFDLQPEPEPEPDYDKSDHEFSPESDLESEEPAEPLKRARTLQEEKDDGFCKKCGSGKQPEWILLCDKCDAGYHASCLKPLLFYIPQGDWFCPPCNHEKLIHALESELVKLDALAVIVEQERARKKLEEPEPVPVKTKEEKKDSDDEDSEASSYSSWSSASSGGVYRLRARRQLPVSLRAQEYDRLISAAIKEEYMEPTTSAGNQGRGKDISTIIEAAEEEKMKAERDAIEQGVTVESKKSRKKQRKKPRKLNSLDVPSEDDDEVDEDFKDTGAASSSEDISSSADKDSGDSGSSDSLPIRRTGRSENKKERPKMTESSPETKKKKKGVFEDSSSESAGAKDWATASKPKSKPSHHHHHRTKDRSKKRDKLKKSRRSRGLTQYDAEGNVIRARVTYGGLSGEEGENDWSPKHRTRQKKINYTEMPNTESEDEMHKSSGKHMPDSSDEFKVTESSDSDWDAEQKKKDENSAERMKTLNDLVKKTAVVPLEKLPEDVTKAKTEELQAHLEAQAANATPRPLRGKGSRGGRGSRGPRGRGGRGGGSTRSGSPQTDDALAKLVGVKVKELGQDGSPNKQNQVEREKKRQEREAKLAEKEAKRQERIQKKEEKEKLKEMKAKEREEKKLAKIALQESKRIKKEKEYAGPMVGYGPPPGAMGGEMFQPRLPAPFHDQRFPNPPRLQVRAELRGMLAGEDRGAHTQQQHNALREGTLSVAGSPQPFKPVSEEPSIITRMPHMINQQYRGPMMYNNSGYGPRGPQNMYQLHPGLGGPGGPPGQARQYPPQYYRLPPYGPAQPERPHQPYRHHMQGPPGPPGSMHHPGPPGSMHHPPGFGYRGPPPASMPQGHMQDRSGASPNPPSHLGGHPNSHAPQNLGPPTTIGGPNHQAGHLGPPSHLVGQQSHLNQLGRPPGLQNPLAPNSHEGPNSHGPPNAGSPVSHGPPNPLRGPPNPHVGPPNPLGGPPISHGGPPNSHGGPPNSHGGPPNSHGGPPNSHVGPPNSHVGPPNSHGGPPNSHAGPPNSHGGPRSMLESNPGTSQMARESSPIAGTSGMKHGAPPSVSGPTGPAHNDEPPIKIKAEVKTEPEYRSPPTSPVESVGGASAGAREDTPRHPKIKHTENKDRRPRFPLGPYAPHYTPYGPYAPHYAPETHHTLQQYLSTERPRSPAPSDNSPRPYLPTHLRPYGMARPPPPHHGAVPGLPPHSHHPMPNQNLPPSPGPAVNPRPPSPHRTPRPAHPQIPLIPNVPPPSSHPLTHPPPTSHRLQSHHRFPSQPTPLIARNTIPPQAHSHPPTTLPPQPIQAHLTQPRSPLRSPGPRRQSVTPPQNPPLHQPYVQQAQMLQAPLVPSRPTPPPAMAQSPSPHNAHLMSQPLLGPRRTPPLHPARTPPNLGHHGPPQHERVSPNAVSYQYAERRPLLPQPIPRDSLPPHSPPRRDLEPQRREFEPPEPQKREFELQDTQRREFGPLESQRREFGPPESQRREFGIPESQRREFGTTESQRQEFEPPESHRRDFGPPETQRQEFEHTGSQRRDFEHPGSQRRELGTLETQRRVFVPPESQGRQFDPESQPREFETPESPKESALQAEADSTIAVKTEPMLGRVKEEPNREEGGVFGGLVSYFSSQHEDDIDA